jgi:hypothetical protein
MPAHAKDDWSAFRPRLKFCIFARRGHQLVLANKTTNPQEEVALFLRAIFSCKTRDPARNNRAMIDSSSTISSGMLNPAEEELSALPIWAFTLGVFALLTFGLTAVPSIICGHVALAKTKGAGNRSLAKSVAMTGLVIGYVGAALLGTWVVVAARYLSLS